MSRYFQNLKRLISLVNYFDSIFELVWELLAIMRNVTMLSWVKVNKTCRLNYLMRKIWFGGEAALPTFLDKQNKLQSTSCCQRNVFQTLWSNEASALSPSGPGWTSLCFLCILQFWAFPKMSNSFSTLGLQCFLSRPGLFVLFTQREALCGDVIPGLLLPKSLYSWHTRTRSHYLET